MLQTSLSQMSLIVRTSLMFHCTRSLLAWAVLPAAPTGTVGNCVAHTIQRQVSSVTASFSRAITSHNRSHPSQLFWLSMQLHGLSHRPEILTCLTTSSTAMYCLMEKLSNLCGHGNRPWNDHMVLHTPISVRQCASYTSPCSLFHGHMGSWRLGVNFSTVFCRSSLAHVVFGLL